MDKGNADFAANNFYIFTSETCRMYILFRNMLILANIDDIDN